MGQRWERTKDWFGIINLRLISLRFGEQKFRIEKKERIARGLKNGQLV